MADAFRIGGIVVSVVSTDPVLQRTNVRSVFFYVQVTSERLNAISRMLNARILIPQVGSIVPLEQARRIHEMLAGHLIGVERWFWRL
ncbi:MAG: hypothetical protein JO356_13385 [Acidobacteria bacterium]|nr:hypothetical protein [Acidobacteriota bacterium]